MRASVSRLWGGESEVNDAELDDKPGTQKFTIGTSYFVTPSTQLMFNYGRDTSVDNGFKESDRINLRIMQMF
ncbi:hypothetical protein D3C73_1524700 [compost metagenome]